MKEVRGGGGVAVWTAGLIVIASSAFALVVAGCSASGNGSASDDAGAGGGDGSSASDAHTSDGSSGNDSGSTNDGGTASESASDAKKDSGPACTSLVNGGTGIMACDTCQIASCCNEFNTCWGDTDCLALLNCAFDCVADAGTGDAGAACEGTCESQHQGAVQAFHDWLFCTNASCKTQCQ